MRVRPPCSAPRSAPVFGPRVRPPCSAPVSAPVFGPVFAPVFSYLRYRAITLASIAAPLNHGQMCCWPLSSAALNLRLTY
ncbi:hypothetical protein CgunFtcFv8_018487 [Champsocephalus gunnari]|uniref:Uncharacterized protein n=1 Tax=Champsocephalus gunnari TaxID=52237 RepID=A0AAN8BW35_CHAGU|nr:hypothetical protein CgunFtcFv8_018487 [Champsocephalus gunnari]